jgi:hypothetical protein
MVPASRQLKPAKNLADKKHPPNLPVKAKAMIAIVNPQVIPIISRSRQLCHALNGYDTHRRLRGPDWLKDPRV